MRFLASQYEAFEGESVFVCATITAGTSHIGFTLGLSAMTDAEG